MRILVFLTFLVLATHVSAKEAQGVADQTIPSQSEGRRQGNGGNNSTQPFSVPVRILEEPEEAESTKLEKQEAAQREIDDLAAQQGVDQSTKKLVLLTIAQTVLAFFGTIALLYSLLLNRKATYAAVEASTAAREAIGVERAWLTFSGMRNEFHTDLKMPDGVVHAKAIAFSPKWMNTGRTPALKSEALSMGNIIGFEDPIPEFTPKDNDGEVMAMVIGPGVTVNSFPFYVVGDNLTALLGRHKRVAIYSKVTYADVYQPGITRCSECCISIKYKGQHLAENGEVTEIFDVAATGPQNTAS
ncbi:hypothetical protein [Mesorhizobium sp. 113-3-3]|uniref:hypothetical protein n=1 Tax=Mesorhizobium sp. 113-3-3 TaxID=2744516 RepID=UPI001925E1B6|nr:hypothetical protein [Mesorhizobium sp. 113-3-3]BCG77800.1 hypothetical protein MesoLj113b_13420 [Mesorhizobium sp. 113-3-3]